MIKKIKLAIRQKINFGNQKHGFTLIELMTVVAIIAILTSVSVVSIVKSQTRSRDVKRKADIATIETALATYYVQNKVYPLSVNWNVSNNQAAPMWIALNNYIDKLPNDPIGPKDNTLDLTINGANRYGNQYFYSYRSAATTPTKYSAIPNPPPVAEYTACPYYRATSQNNSWSGCGNNGTNDGTCYYRAQEFYMLGAHLENSNDSDSVEKSNQYYLGCYVMDTPQWSGRGQGLAPNEYLKIKVF